MFLQKSIGYIRQSPTHPDIHLNEKYTRLNFVSFAHIIETLLVAEVISIQMKQQKHVKP